MKKLFFIFFGFCMFVLGMLGIFLLFLFIIGFYLLMVFFWMCSLDKFYNKFLVFFYY